MQRGGPTSFAATTRVRDEEGEDGGERIARATAAAGLHREDIDAVSELAKTEDDNPGVHCGSAMPIPKGTTARLNSACLPSPLRACGHRRPATMTT